MSNQKNVFWQALVMALLIFGSGILVGIFIEEWRSEKLNKLYAQAELNLLDVRIQKDLYEFGEIECKSAVEENIKFANRVYEEAKLLSRYDNANKITEDVIIQHKKYDLLRIMFWMNSIEIKRRCNAAYHNVVYLYKYDNPSLEKRAEQKVFSNALSELKNDLGDDVMLIPIAADLNMSSTNLLLEIYNITTLPTILIDEKIKITEVKNIEDEILRSYF